MRTDVRAGDVHLDRVRDPRGAYPLHQLAEFANVLSLDRDDHRAGELGQDRNLDLEESLETGVLDPDRVEHPRRSLHDARRGIAGAGVARHGLRDDAPDRAQVHEPVVLDPVSDDSRGDEHRIPELERADADFQRGGHGSRSQSTRVASMTGPSRHIAGYRPPFPFPPRSGTGHPRHAPTAQAMGPSSEAWHRIPCARANSATSCRSP